jgi:hypothetical protein
MVPCAGIRADGGRCGAQVMRNSQWCIGHDPEQAEARRRRASKGSKRGGRGRPVAELAGSKPATRSWPRATLLSSRRVTLGTLKASEADGWCEESLR